MLVGEMITTLSKFGARISDAAGHVNAFRGSRTNIEGKFDKRHAFDGIPATRFERARPCRHDELLRVPLPVLV